MNVCGKELRIRGRVLRIARLEADRYEYLDDPVAAIDELRTAAGRIDIFSFMQRLSEPLPKYPYRMELDNLAAVTVSTFDHWWNKQVNGKTACTACTIAADCSGATPACNYGYCEAQ